MRNDDYILRRIVMDACSVLTGRKFRAWLVIIISHFLFLIPHSALAQGLPFIRNYTAAEYGAHNRNFDIEVGEDGTVFVANFEGLLYYDRAQWRIIHTAENKRVTVVYRASDNRIWIGGYNFFALLQRKANGELFMQRVGKAGTFTGEVMEIYEKDGAVQLVASNNIIYEVSGGDLVMKKQANTDFKTSINSDIVDVGALERGEADVVQEGITQTEELDCGLKALVKENEGLIIADSIGREVYRITEANGLCSDQVAYVAYDGRGLLWGATAHGIFSIEIPSAYTWLQSKDGVSGEIHTLAEYDGVIYMGGNNGVFRQRGYTVERVGNLNVFCWDLKTSSRGLLAATASGVWLIERSGLKRLTSNSTTAMMLDGERLYVAEPDGLYVMNASGGGRQKVSETENVTKIMKDARGALWIQNVYGEIYSQRAAGGAFERYGSDGRRQVFALVKTGNEVRVVEASDREPFPYPAYATTDDNGTTWLTDKEGKHLYQWKDGHRATEVDWLLKPVGEMAVEGLMCKDGKVWIGGDERVVVIDTNKDIPTSLRAWPRLMFRSVVMGRDSILWGGYGDMPGQLPTLDSDERRLRFTFALSHAPLTGQTLYRYRLNNDEWSAWSEKQEVEFLNLPYGSFKLAIQAQLADGEQTEVTETEFHIHYPLLMRWYMVIIYLMMLAGLIYLFFRYRLMKLRKDKIKLERIVEDRTKEIVCQKDEIEEKSKSLEKALDDLNNAQTELIRQEKMASVGKLTEGLIDRILNPMNYIINFSKVSNELIDDLRQNIENNKDRMDENDYLDTEDVLDLLSQNLKDVDRYGHNTTRIIKAMEEMLKDRTGGYVDMDLRPVLLQNEEMLHNYYAKEAEQWKVKITFDVPESEMIVHGNGDMLSRVIMSLLGNSMYAVMMKAKTMTYSPEVSLVATREGDQYVLTIRDNGVGIEANNIEKIFDPFFTTKPSGEASGTGLYLSREIIQNHGGDITVKSVQDEGAEFTITLPIATHIISDDYE
jgi:signal transduction histidine kinase